MSGAMRGCVACVGRGATCGTATDSGTRAGGDHAGAHGGTGATDARDTDDGGGGARAHMHILHTLHLFAFVTAPDSHITPTDR